MGKFNIREYDKLATDVNGHTIQAGVEPAIAATAVTTSGTKADTTLNIRTRFCLIGGDGIVNWAVSSAAVAGAGGRMAADEKQFIGVEQGKTALVLSVIDDS